MQKVPRRNRVKGIAPDEWATLGRAWIGLAIVDLGLRTRGFKRVRQWGMFQVRRAPRQSCSATSEQMDRLYHLVAIAGRHHLYPMLCLRRTLVLQWLLADRGVASEIRLGVARGETGIDAHAWLEREGRVIGEEDEIAHRFHKMERGSQP